jgi:hypothetical protein
MALSKEPSPTWVDYLHWNIDLVGPVGFEPTTSGPDLLGVTSAPGSPSITGLWYPLGGVNPLDQARRRPPLLGLNLQVFYLSVGRTIMGSIPVTWGLVAAYGIVVSASHLCR